MASGRDIAKFRKAQGITLSEEDGPPEVPESLGSMVDELLAKEEDPVADTPAESVDIYSPTPDDKTAEVRDGVQPAESPATVAEAAVPEPPAPEPDAWTPPTREEYEKAQKLAKERESDIEMYLRSPDLFLNAYFQTLTPQQQQAYLAQIQQQSQAAAPPAPLKIEGFEEELATPAEKAVAQNYEWLRDGRQMTERYVQQTAQALQSQQQLMLDYHAAIMEQKVNALLELVGAKLPEVDPAQVQALLNQGKPVREAVSALYSPSVKAEVERVKKAREIANKETPKTLGNGSNVGKALPKGASFEQILEHRLGRPLRD